METSDSTLKQLSQSAGVDLLALKKKYAGVKAAAVEPTLDHSGSSSASTTEIGKLSVKEQFERLDKYTVCKECHGLGLIKYVYNHMSMQKTCPECDGDSLQVKQIKQLGIAVGDGSGEDSSVAAISNMDETD